MSRAAIKLFAPLALGAYLLGAEPFQFALRPHPVKPEDQPKAQRLGELKLNGDIRLPAFQLTVKDGIAESGWSTATPDSLEVRSTCDPKFAGRLSAFYHTNGWILVPKDWKAVRGANGVDGSEAITFAPPTGVGRLSYWTPGACVGCALSTAAVFFPEAQREAKKEDFLFYNGTNVPLKTVRIRPKMVAYRAVVEGQPIDGLALFDPDNDYFFFMVEVSLPDQDRDLAKPILNWFLPKK